LVLVLLMMMFRAVLRHQSRLGCTCSSTTARLVCGVLEAEGGAFPESVATRASAPHGVKWWRPATSVAGVHRELGGLPPSTCSHSSRPLFSFSTKSSEEEKAEEKAAAGAEEKPQEEGEGQEEEPKEEEEGGAPCAEEELSDLRSKCEALEATVAKMGGENADYKDKLIRTLADMENLRERTARQVENSQKFAVQGFVKDLLDVSDNFERALAAVDVDYLKSGGEGEAEAKAEGKAFGFLKSLHEGIEMTEKQMLSVLKKNGVERFDPTGQPFDPNLHEARFEVPVPDKEPGTVVVVTKVGYTLHDRVIRPAEVGVVPEK